MMDRFGKLTRFSLLFLLGFALFSAPGQAQRVWAQETPGKEDPDEVRQMYFDRVEADVQAALAEGEPPAQGFTPCVGGSAAGYACKNVDLLAFLPHSSIGGGSGNDIWGWTDPQTGREYALVGQSAGTAFVDITNPINPIYLGRLPTHTSNSTWRDIKVYKNRAFIVSEASGHGIQVFDLRRLRSVPAPPQVFTEDAHYGSFGSAHNIAINEATGFAYVVGASSCGGGLTFVNISSPNNPFGAGCFSADGYTHDAQCVVYSGPDADYQGDEVCFAYNEDTLTIVNVTSKSAPFQIARKSYSGARYTHQGWVTDDQVYLLLGDEMDETTFGHSTRTRIWNISNLDNPVLIGIYDGPNASIDHNLYIANGYAFEANYSSGLQILSLGGIAGGSLVQAGHFDTYKTSNNPGIIGAWSVYPYFESGTIAVNGIGEGLFLLQPTALVDFTISPEDDVLSVCVSGSKTTGVQVGSVSGYSGTVALGTVGLPPGSTAVFTPPSVSVPGTSAVQVHVASSPAGTFAFSLTGFDGAIQRSTPMTLKVFDSLPGPVNLVYPGYGTTGTALQPDFRWSAAPRAETYLVEIASDPGFTNILDSAVTDSANYTPAAPLDMRAKYFWRVTPVNPCGAGTPSAFSYFVTESLYCRAVSLPIPDDSSSGVTDQLTISDSFTLRDLDITIEANHTWVGDLKFKIKHQESGTAVIVMDRPGVPASTYGCSGDDLDVVLDDEAGSLVENQCAAGTPTIFGSFIPNSSLTPFEAENLSGTWLLTASDLSANDTGTLRRWCLGADVDLAPEADILILPAALSAGQPQDMRTSHTLQIANTGNIPLNWTVGEANAQCTSPADVPWLSVSPNGGITNPAQKGAVILTFDSSGLAEGTYTASVCITSNDPDASLVSVPVSLRVVETLYDVYLPAVYKFP